MKQIASKVNELITVRMISRQQGQDRRENRAFPRRCQPLLHLTRGRLNGRVSWRRDEEEEGYLDVLLEIVLISCCNCCFLTTETDVTSI